MDVFGQRDHALRMEWGRQGARATGADVADLGASTVVPVLVDGAFIPATTTSTDPSC